MTLRQEKVATLIKEEVASYLSEESNRMSLITVTNATISPDLARATIYISVLPEDREEEALGFVMRQGTALRKHLKKRCSLRRIPHLDFEIDYGEKNRQRIDELSHGEK